MNRWFRHEKFLVNLDQCTGIYPDYESPQILVFKSNDNIYRISFSSKQELKDKFEEISNILMEKNPVFDISELTQEIKKLRKAVMYLPVIGSEYQKAEKEFEGNQKIVEDKVVEKSKE